MKIYKYRGFIYIKDCDTEYDWLSYPQSGNPYFLLNLYTRERFKEDILPLIKSKQAEIDRGLFNEIRYYNGNLVHYPKANIVNLPGITYKPHQVEALKFMMMHDKFGFFLGPGSGKTIIAIAFLLSMNIKEALIVTPQKVVDQYKKEVDKYIPGNNYIVTNFEQLHKYTEYNLEALIIDESHKAKNYSSNVNALCREIAKKTKYTYLFTGTPQDKLKHEILAQIAILDERVMPSKTKTIERYFVLNDYFQPSMERKAFSDELTSIIEDYTWGRKTEDVVQLTKEHNHIVNVKKPQEYDRLLQDRVIKFNTATMGTVRCVADNKGVLKVKLREICNGHLMCEDEDGVPILFNISNIKSKSLGTLIATTVNKGIIYYEFEGDIHHITKALDNCYKDYRILNGKTNKKLIPSIIEDFKSDKYDFLVMQSKSGNAGLDLTSTNNIIFYSLPESYIVYTQCKARINRIGQTKECNYYYLICEDSVEGQIYAALNKKKNFSTRLFKIYY